MKKLIILFCILLIAIPVFSVQEKSRKIIQIWLQNKENSPHFRVLIVLDGENGDWYKEDGKVVYYQLDIENNESDNKVYAALLIARTMEQKIKIWGSILEDGATHRIYKAEFVRL